MSQAVLSEPFDPTIPLPNSEPLVVEEVGSVGMLLKSPQSFVRLVAQDRFDWQPIIILMATAYGFYSLYGLAMGFFAGGNSLWQATLKAPMVLLGSAALCAPSLYVLLCLSGVALNLRQSVAMLTGVAALSSVLMVGFAPVAWLFGVSTNNLQFMMGLHMIVWGVALGCGLRLLAQSVPGGFRNCKSIVVWSAIFLVVSAQMLTYLRPVLGVALEGKFREREKQFFFQHFYTSIVGQQKLGAAPEPAPVVAPPTPSTEPGAIAPPSYKPVSN